MAFNQTAARPLFSRNAGAAPTGVQMARQLRTGLRPAPDPSIAVTPTPLPNEAPVAPVARTVRPAPQMARPTTPNAGGYMQRTGGPTVAVPPSPAATGANLGGTITRPLAPGVTATTRIPAATVAPQQTEAANPLTGDTTNQPEDTTSAIDPAKAAGFSSRGATVPSGADSVGGTGIFQRKFSNQNSANLYGEYVRRLFGNEPEIA